MAAELNDECYDGGAWRFVGRIGRERGSRGPGEVRVHLSFLLFALLTSQITREPFLSFVDAAYDSIALSCRRLARALDRCAS